MTQPTETGQYWFKRDKNGKWLMVEIIDKKIDLYVLDFPFSNYLLEYDNKYPEGQWSGPLKEPS